MKATRKNGKAVTIKDIAREAEVSYATVSRALSGSESIHPDTRRKVLDICARMGYTVNYVARSMVMRETRLLGLILPTVDNPYMSELAYHIECGARARDYSIMLCNSSYDLAIEERAFTLLLGRQVDGIVLFPAERGSFQNLRKYFDKVPTVFVNENLQDKPASYVTVDNYQGTWMGVEYLYGLGHRRILYFGRQQTSVGRMLRAQGYQDACTHYGLPPLFCDSRSDALDAATIELGCEMARGLFAKRRDFTAIMAAADTLALGVLQAADEAGIRIPEELSLLGFDNIRYTSLPKINLSTIEQPKKAIATVALELLIDKIRTDAESYSHRILTPTLIKRSSCTAITPTQP